MSQAPAQITGAATLVEDAQRRLIGSTPEDVLRWGFANFAPGRIALCTSLQHEGMVLLDMAHRIDPSVHVFTIDSGRLPQQTLDLIEEVRERYKIAIEVIYPDATEVGDLVTQHGPNLFYNSPELRLSCCDVRKVRPLKRRLTSLDAWISGLRRDQNAERSAVVPVQLDVVHGGIVKLNPLAGWTEEQVLGYVEQNRLPRNALYSRGYTSIGCEPCTRATEPGEDPRAGRWWWEQGARECGIHYELAVDAGGTTRVSSERVAKAGSRQDPSGVPDDRSPVPELENA
ncbi:MAG: phosphoadenosine phosphosulfate reductase [Chloroflexota bacterium]|nr:phosphoadenosine phosphosulfate reductase [Chloroflexota bacterium]